MRTFCTAFVVTVCLVGLFVGLFAVGYGSRRTAQGEGLPFTYRIQNGRLLITDQTGETYTLQLTREDANTAPLTPAPIRLSGHLVQTLTVLIERAAAHFTAYENT